jgi:hypothetical protein
LVSGGNIISGSVLRSVLYSSVRVHSYASVKWSVLLPQVVFIEHDDMIEQLPPTGPHPTLGHSILPRTLNTRP